MMKDDDHERCIFISYSCLCPVFCVNDGCHTNKDSHLHLCEQRNRTMTNDRIQTTHYLNFALDFHISIFVKLLKSNGCHTFEFPSLWSNITDRRTPYWISIFVIKHKEWRTPFVCISIFVNDGCHIVWISIFVNDGCHIVWISIFVIKHNGQTDAILNFHLCDITIRTTRRYIVWNSIFVTKRKGTADAILFKIPSLQSNNRSTPYWVSILTWSWWHSCW